MQIEESQIPSKKGKIIILSLIGELDVRNADQLEKKINQVILPIQTKVIIDMNKINYIDSTGIRFLINAHKKNIKNQGFIAFINTSKIILKIFRLTKLDSILKLFDQQGKAIDYLEQS
ncbi:MAG: STAS domain-containing protein [Spirochaetes bacterium]|nr:STAS domain-containing protein [Spirochaetota bacterium]